MADVPFEYSPMISRKPLQWPNRARVALWVILNIEHFDLGKPLTGYGVAGSIVPDVRNYALRDYGARVGIWRLMDLLDRYKIRGTVALNSNVCEYYPIIVEEGKRRDWEFMGHGMTNSQALVNLPEAEERQIIRTSIRVIEKKVGKRPEGWLGSALAETYNTLDILAEEGIKYVSDWCNDDQPYLMKLKKGTLISAPYSMELNDLPAFYNYHLAPDQFGRMIKDQFDVLYQEGATSGRVMAIALHPFIIAQPFRIKYLEEALEYITRHSDVWLTTGSEFVRWYSEHCL
jgi:allantoinase